MEKYEWGLWGNLGTIEKKCGFAVLGMVEMTMVFLHVSTKRFGYFSRFKSTVILYMSFS